MTFRKLAIATALLATTASYAVAQNTTSPASQARPGMQGDDSSKPSGMQNKAGTQTGPNGSAAGTTTGTGISPSKDTMDKNVSPASPNAGEKQQK